MFPDRKYSFNELKHLTEKVTALASLTPVRVTVDHTMPTPLQKSTNILISVFTQSRLHLLSKRHLKQAFFSV